MEIPIHYNKKLKWVSSPNNKIEKRMGIIVPKKVLSPLYWENNILYQTYSGIESYKIYRQKDDRNIKYDIRY